VTDTDGAITYANPTMEDVSGYDLSELKGSSPALLKSGVHGEEFYRELWETITDGDVWEGEVVNERKDGEQYVINQTISPIAESGEITGFVAINRDITERKQRERQRAFFEQAVEQIGTGIAAYDSNGTITYTNPAYAGMLGATPQGLEGESVTVVNPELDADRFDAYWDSFDEGEIRRRETVNRRLDTDATFPVGTVTTHVRIEGEEYHVGTVQDITERKEREREFQTFRKAVEQAGHGVLVTDTDATIEYVNPAFEEMTGFDREEALGNTPAMLNSGEHGGEFYRTLWETILNGEVWTGEIVNERKDGRQYVIDQTIAPLTEDDEITGFVAINRDITELKEQRRELQRQNDRLENFGRTVAHDLRNPLNVMDANLEMARSGEDSEQAYTRMRDAVDRMEALIDELLALAKQGKSVLDPKPASLEDVARAAWNNVDTQIMRLAVDGDVTLEMDASRVQELFANLYRNSREHAGPDATVRVGPLEDGFYIEDDGPGIPPDVRDDVLRSGFTTSEEGTGFGLTIVSQIAQAHDWDVEIGDGSAGGARFEFQTVDSGESRRTER
jgi:PAS domain S-box-containing protein